MDNSTKNPRQTVMPTFRVGAAILAVSVGCGLLIHPTRALSAEACPDPAAIQAALSQSVAAEEVEGTCQYDLDGKRLTIEFETGTFNDRKADAQRRTAKLQKTKAGKYSAVTYATNGIARFEYNQKGRLIYISHFEVNARSSKILADVAKRLSALVLPGKIVNCAPVTAAVRKAVPDAKFDKLESDNCSYSLSDDSGLSVGADADTSWSEQIETLTFLLQGKTFADFQAKGKPAFAYFTTGETTAVVQLTNRLGIITFDDFSDRRLEDGIPAKVAAVLT